MTIEYFVETDPGCNKQVFIDSSLKGLSSPDYNFRNLLQAYSLKDGRKILGTKSVVINAEGFLDSFLEFYGISKEFKDKISSRLADEIHKSDQESGFVSYFWNNISEVHHRDIMRTYFAYFKDKLDDFYNDFLADVDTDHDLDQAIKIERSLQELNDALSQLYCIKKGGKDTLNESAKLVLAFSQGYQLSSNNLKDIDDLWTSQIRKLELSSGITKDQEKNNIKISKEEVCNNMNYFLKSLKNVEINTNVIEIPKHLEGLVDNTEVISTKVYSIKNLFQENTVKPLKILYV